MIEMSPITARYNIMISVPVPVLW